MSSNNLSLEQRRYLFSRGYTRELVVEEEIYGINSDIEFILDRRIKGCAGCVAWLAVSMSGTPIGVQTRELKEKKYRWHQFDNVEHLPMLYGSEEDWRLLFESGFMILTEGPFDRIAVKRALPTFPVFARLSKGTSNQMINLIKRYVRNLWLIFDMDEEGKAAAKKSEDRLGDDVNVYRLSLPFKDPSECLRKRSLDYLTQALLKQINSFLPG